MPRISSRRFTSSKCSRQGAHRNSNTLGASAAIASHPGFLQSRIRSGFRSNRSLPAAHSSSLHDRVFDVRADRGRGALRAKGEAARALVLERVHLLAHDVRGLSHAADEERGVLGDRRADLLISERAERPPRHLLQVLPDLHPSRQEIVHPLHAGDSLTHCHSPSRWPIRTSASSRRPASHLTRPCSKRRTTVEPISNTPTSSPLAMGMGVTYPCTRAAPPLWVITSSYVARMRATQVAPTFTTAKRPARVSIQVISRSLAQNRPSRSRTDARFTGQKPPGT